MGITRALVERFHSITFSQIPPVVLHRAKRAMLDAFGAMYAGSNHPVTELLKDFVIQYNAPPLPNCAVPLFGTNVRMDPINAAFVQGSAMHILDFEPLWHPPTHPCSPILPALLSLVAIREVSAQEFLTSFIVGLEVQARLILFCDQHHVPTKFHPPGTQGMVACAIACSHLMGLDLDQTSMALGIACSRASGIMVNVGTMTKSTHPGHAARMGLESSLLAKEGFTASHEALTHIAGYFSVFYHTKTTFDPNWIQEIANPFWLESQDIGIKKYPSQFSTQWAIEAAIRLHSQIEVASIQSIEIEWPLMKYLDRSKPKSELDAKFSLQFLVAAALLFGDINNKILKEFNHPDIQKLLSKTKLMFNESIPPSFDTLHGNIVLILQDGKKIEEFCGFPVGHWKNPISDEKLIEKFIQNTEPVLGQKKTKERIDQILQLENWKSTKDLLT